MARHRLARPKVRAMSAECLRMPTNVYECLHERGVTARARVILAAARLVVLVSAIRSPEPAMDKHETTTRTAVNTLEPYWMPFTGKRHFKRNPRMLASASGMYYTSDDGRKILDGCAGLWCVNAGHGRREVTEAIQRTASELDFAPSFQMGHPLAFELASRLTATLPGDFDHVFYCNSGSEAVDTALKIALAYHQAKGDFRRTRLIGRERGYHGVGFGGISVGGIVANRRTFAAALLPQIDHLPHTHDLAKNAFSRGQPEHGAHFADALESICALHDPSTIAAVIV